MSSGTRTFAGLGLLVTGVLIGATGAMAVETRTPSFLDAGAFTVLPGEDARFFVSLHDRAKAVPASVLLQILDEAGAVVVERNISLAAGKTTSIAVHAPGKYRAHARILDAPRVFLSERRILGTVEVGNELTLTIRPVCTMHEPDVSGKG